MTKKEKILKLFEDAYWIPYTHSSGEELRAKTITHDDFAAAGLCATQEYGETYCDIIYAARILRSLGYRVLYGFAFHIYEKPKSQTKRGVRGDVE